MSAAHDDAEPQPKKQNGQQSGHSTERASESSRRRGGLESDVHRLIDAVSGLAEASARPVASALQVIADNVGGKEEQPRVRFHNLEQTGTELLAAAVRLAENVASVGLQALGVQPGSAPPVSAARLPRTAAGETLRIPLSIENPSARAMEGLRFEVEPMRGPDAGEGHATIAATQVRLQPDTLDIAAGDFEKLTVFIEVPADAAPGSYAGALRLQGDDAFRVPVRFQVTAPLD